MPAVKQLQSILRIVRTSSESFPPSKDGEGIEVQGCYFYEMDREIEQTQVLLNLFLLTRR